MAPVTAERSLLAALAAGCSALVAAYGEGDRKPRMLVAVMNTDGSRVLHAHGGAPGDGACKLGRDLAAELLRSGARDLLERDARPRGAG